jgi:TrmH family RNA methyltransferase
MAHSAPRASQQSDRGSATTIASRDNRWLKRFRAALAGEPDQGKFVGVEGVRLVEAALGSNLPVEALLVSDSGGRHLARLAPLLGKSIPVFRTSDKLFASVADTQAPQGIAGLVQPRAATIADCLAGGAPAMVLAGVQDPGNVGTIVRAAEAFGAAGVATCMAGGVGTADPFGAKALRASAGSALRLPIVLGNSWTQLRDELRRHGARIYAAVAAAEGAEHAASASVDGASLPLPPWDIDWKIPAAILIGNEGAGLPDELVHAADARVCIPQAEATARVGLESLNAAMAACALLYEAMRQRKTARRFK